MVTLYVLAAATPKVSIVVVELCQVVLMVLAVRLAMREWRTVASHPLFWLASFFVLYVLVRGWVGSMERPDLFYQQWEGTRRWIKAGLLPALLVMLGVRIAGAREKQIVGMLIALLAGFTLRLLYNSDWGAFIQGLNGNERYSFDLMLAFTSLLFGMALLGVLIFFPRVLRNIGGGRKRRAVAGIVWAGVGLFYLAALVASGTRTAWIATVVGGGVVVIVGAVRWRLLSFYRREVSAGLVVLLIAGAIGTYSFGERISDRITPTLDAMHAGLQMMDGDEGLHDVPTDSLGIRIAYNVYGARMFSERPFFGYGPANPAYLVSGDNLPSQLRGRDDHFHSTPWDALLRLGLIGSVPILAWYVLAFYGICRGWRSGRLAPSTGLFLIGYLVSYAVWSLADVRFANYAISGHLALFTGVACSCLFPEKSSAPPSPSEDSALQASEEG